MTSFLKPISLLITILLSTIVFAQTPDFSLPEKSKESINIEEFDYVLLEEIILVKINKYRNDENLELLKERIELKKTAFDQSYLYSVSGISAKNDLSAKSIEYGGTGLVSEVKGWNSLKNRNELKTYNEIASELMSKWIENDNYKQDLYGDFYQFIGVGTYLSADNNRVFASIVLGNLNSFAIESSSDLSQYVSSKSFKLNMYDAKACRRVPSFDKLFHYSDGISVDEKGKIMLNLNDAKEFKKIVRSEKDGLIVDIVQLAQYPCNETNILDYSKSYKGTLLKPIYTSDIDKNNISKEKNSISIKLGELPKNISKNYEINLIVINSDYLCTEISKTNILFPSINEKLTFDFYTLKDPRFVRDSIMNYKNIPAKMDRGFCWRSESKYYQNEFNTFNCLLSRLGNGQIENANDILKINNQINSLSFKETINQDTLTLLNLAIQNFILNSTTIDADSKAESMSKIETMELPKISQKNTLALISIFLEQKNYIKALEMMEKIVFSEDVTEDFLFSYITLSCLYRERMMSGTFARAFALALKMNNDKLCNMFYEERLSFQILENFKVKELYCNSCR